MKGEIKSYHREEEWLRGGSDKQTRSTEVWKDEGMRGWVIKLLTVGLVTACAWWAEQTVTTATAGDRRRDGFGEGDLGEGVRDGGAPSAKSEWVSEATRGD